MKVWMLEMNVTEIMLIIAGVIIMLLGYIVPAKKNELDDDLQLISEDEVRKLIDREVEGVKEHIADIVDETVTYSMEKTERSMERIANEKIMAINEYSDTVLEEINKNHKEVLFLYDMLNDRHENLKGTVSEALKTAEEIKQTLKDAEITAKEAEMVAKEAEMTVKESGDGVKGRIDTVFDDVFVPIMPPRVEIIHEPNGDYVAPETDEAESIDWNRFISANEEGNEVGTEIPEEEFVYTPQTEESINSRNSNDRILELHKAGKSTVTIAKELGLGIGEVQLVIDLFEG
ncbi:MAG: hypothetical protein J1E98_12310 [Lachnospiraceae bacterium]|nr:hypothetical protein [Lachnospiraceae bacterium]